MKTISELNEDLRHSLGAFARWMNRPLARVHVLTWRLAVDLEGTLSIQPKPLALRYRPAYRSSSVLLWRRVVANHLRSTRKQNGRLPLPIYDERSGRYV